MTSFPISPELHMLVTFGPAMDDIVASLPYVLPMLTLGILLLLYQRHLPHESKKRNLTVLIGILSFAVAIIATLYASLGGTLGFGSWTTFVNGLQLLTNLFFGSVLSSLVYVAAFIVVLSSIAYFIISPPDPDFTLLRDELKNAKEESKTMKDNIQKLEAEKKRLTEFVTEKEDSLTALSGELEGIKAEIGERETSIALMEEQLKAKEVPSVTPEGDVAQQLKMKDHRIASLESEISDLRIAAASAHPVVDDGIVPELSSKLKEAQDRWDDLSRRAEAASEVSDSVISDLVELISEIESSKRNEGAKKALVPLIESLGRSMTRVSREVGDSHGEEPKVEMIGAILMVNEIVDTVKKLVRQ